MRFTRRHASALLALCSSTLVASCELSAIVTPDQTAHVQGRDGLLAIAFDSRYEITEAVGRFEDIDAVIRAKYPSVLDEAGNELYVELQI